MRGLTLFVLSLVWTFKVVKCSSHEEVNTPTEEKNFRFDLADQKSSDKYVLSHRLTDPFVVTTLRPLEGLKLEKLTDGHETVAEFEPSDEVTELVYLPRKNPRLLSFKYNSNGKPKSKSFRKLYSWYEISPETYTYFYTNMASKSKVTTLNLANLKEGTSGVETENYRGHKCFSLSLPTPFTTSKVMYGEEVLWEATSMERVTAAFVSKDSSPKLVSLCLTDGETTDFKYFTSSRGKFMRVTQPEFKFALDNYVDLGDQEYQLDLNKPDTSKVEVVYAPVDGLTYVNIHPKDSTNVTSISVGSYLLWTQTKSRTLVNVSYTLEENPRLYNILLSVKDKAQNRDQSIYFMTLADTFYSLPEEEYRDKVKKMVRKKRGESPNRYDLNNLVKKAEKFDFASVVFEPLFSTITEVHCNNNVLWMSKDGSKLLNLHLYAMKNTYLARVKVVDRDCNVSTKYFQDSRSYFEDQSFNLDPSFWMYISSATFFKTVSHQMLTQTYHSVDLTSKVDFGSFEGMKAVYNGVVVKTMVPYPSHTCSSVFYQDQILWSSTEDVLLGLAAYGKLETNKDQVKNKEDYQMTELFVRRNLQVVRLYYMKTGEVWNEVDQSKFDEGYRLMRY